jgi:hypothetical protein
MKTWGSGCVVPPFLASSLDGSEWSASRPGRFTHWEKSPWYSLDRRLGGPQSQSGRCGEEKNLTLAGNRTPAIQPVARRCTDWAIPAQFEANSHLYAQGKNPQYLLNMEPGPLYRPWSGGGDEKIKMPDCLNQKDRWISVPNL